MTGLLLLGVLGLWGLCMWWLTGLACAAIRSGQVRLAVRGLLFPFLFLLPLSDEIYSRPEFIRLCQSNTAVVVTVPQLSGKTVWFAGVTSQSHEIGLLQGLEKRWNYVLPGTEVSAFHHTEFHVRGGMFVRMLGISETSAPLLFEGYCASKDALDLRSTLQVTVIDRPH
jgi:hypothetical protein